MDVGVLKPFKRYNPRVWKPWMEMCLTQYLADRSHAEIAQVCGKGEQSIKQFVRSTIFQQRVQELLEASRQWMLNGESGPVAIAEAAAEEAMQTLVDLMRSSNNDHVRRQCAVDLLAHAGLQPTARTEVRVTVEHLVEQMTAEELAVFTETQRWSARLEGEARRLLAVPKR